MKTYIKVKNGLIVQVLDPRDERFDEIVENIDLSGFTKVDLSDAQLDAIIAGEKFDYVNGQVVPHTPSPEELVAALDAARAQKITEVEVYDKSDAVNCFYVSGMPMWLDRETRTSLARTIAIAAEAGETVFSMWYEGPPPVRFDIPIGMAMPMLSALEIYAAATYNVTQSHIAAIYGLATVPEIEAYDHTAGYPEKLTFNL